MFKFAVNKLPLELTGVNFRTIENEKIESYMYVSDIMEEITDEDSPFVPDYGVSGWYVKNLYVGPMFTIDPNGPHILYVTGRPRAGELPPEHRKMFRLEGSVWVHFWEDNKFGYLTQIINKNSKDHED